MKIGVVSAHYMPEVGYQEVHLPRAFARAGHQVKVFTSEASVKLGGQMNKLNYKQGSSKDEKLNFEILRLPALSYKSKAYSFSLKKAVEEFNPDVLVVFGVAKIFPNALLNGKLNKKIKIISVYGDSWDCLDRVTVSQKIKASIIELGHVTIKKHLYKKAVKNSDKIILNIPETDIVFGNLLNKKEKTNYESKKVMLNLGYDPDDYFFDNEVRTEERKKLNLNEEDIVFITSTRIISGKNLEENIKLVDELVSAGYRIKYILSGFLGDDYEKELKKFIQSKKNLEAFICFPFLTNQQIRKLYCAADVGVWSKAAISIQEAMGTGLPILLENKSSVNHLLQENFNGWYFEKNNFNETFKKVIVALSQRKTDRNKLAIENAKTFSYDAIAHKILETIK